MAAIHHYSLQLPLADMVPHDDQFFAHFPSHTPEELPYPRTMVKRLRIRFESLVALLEGCQENIAHIRVQPFRPFLGFSGGFGGGRVGVLEQAARDAWPEHLVFAVTGARRQWVPVAGAVRHRVREQALRYFRWRGEHVVRQRRQGPGPAGHHATRPQHVLHRSQYRTQARQLAVEHATLELRVVVRVRVHQARHDDQYTPVVRSFQAFFGKQLIQHR